MVACFLPQLLFPLFLIGLLVVALWRGAYGLCDRCRTNRKPKCGCPGGDPTLPDVRRPTFKR